MYSRLKNGGAKSLTTSRRRKINASFGEQDDNVVSSVGRHVADTIPNCHPTFLADEGHFSVVYNYIDEILGVLAV